MQFPYQKYPAEPNEVFTKKKSVLRPVIPVGIVGIDGTIFSYAALLDSGADHNIFHAEIGELVGLKVRDGKSLDFWGVTGEKQKAYFHHIEIVVGGHRHKIYCGFVYNFKNLAYGILGQDDFFKLYAVLFDLPKEKNRTESEVKKPFDKLRAKEYLWSNAFFAGLGKRKVRPIWNMKTRMWLPFGTSTLKRKSIF